MPLFLSKADVRNACRDAIRESGTLEARHDVLLTKLDLIIKNQNTIMATQAELAAELTEKTAQIRKAIDEINARLAALDEAVRNSPVTPQLAEAVTALGAAVQAADDIVPDAPPPAP